MHFSNLQLYYFNSFHSLGIYSRVRMQLLNYDTHSNFFGTWIFCIGTGVYFYSILTSFYFLTTLLAQYFLRYFCNPGSYNPLSRTPSLSSIRNTTSNNCFSCNYIRPLILMIFSCPSFFIQE
jgi:hypothetical protein